MTLYKGNTKIGTIYHGSTKIGKIYKGSTLVFSGEAYPSGYVLFESSTPGTYTFTPIANCKVSLILVSGGGGGANNNGRTTGGQGALITGNTTLSKGTEYTVVVGSGGATVDVGNGVTGGGCNGGNGGTSSALGNTCNGGTGAHAHQGWWATSYYNGSPGSGTVASSEFTLTTGTASTNGIYESYGAGGYVNNATNGYCKIVVISS